MSLACKLNMIPDGFVKEGYDTFHAFCGIIIFALCCDCGLLALGDIVAVDVTPVW